MTSGSASDTSCGRPPSLRFSRSLPRWISPDFRPCPGSRVDGHARSGIVDRGGLNWSFLVLKLFEVALRSGRGPGAARRFFLAWRAVAPDLALEGAVALQLGPAHSKSTAPEALRLFRQDDSPTLYIRKQNHHESAIDSSPWLAYIGVKLGSWVLGETW